MALLGFVQVFFEATGDKRSLLLHRPLSPSRIFLAKALVGVGLYTLALGVPFAYLESWYATPGNLAVPFHWQTCLPWLADILSGFVYYFAGMLVAQRKCAGMGAAAWPWQRPSCARTWFGPCQSFGNAYWQSEYLFSS